MKSENIPTEALSTAVEALALSRSIRDILLTEEQRKQIPDLCRTHTLDIIKHFYERIELPFENILSKISQVPIPDYSYNTEHHQLSQKPEDLQNDNTEVRD